MTSCAENRPKCFQENLHRGGKSPPAWSWELFWASSAFPLHSWPASQARAAQSAFWPSNPASLRPIPKPPGPSSHQSSNEDWHSHRAEVHLGDCFLWRALNIPRQSSRRLRRCELIESRCVWTPWQLLQSPLAFLI